MIEKKKMINLEVASNSIIFEIFKDFHCYSQMPLKKQQNYKI